MNVAVFADVHGKLLLCLKLCARWQRETGQKLDLILQAGDMGVYPDRNRLDRATIKYAAADPTELGFSQYFVKKDPAVEAVLAELDCNVVFVRGNHEDHVYLDALEKESDPTAPIFPIDVYGRVFCLKSGAIYNFESKTGEKLSVLGIGRVAAPQNTEIIEAKYIQPYESARIFQHKPSTPVDILLTHDTAEHDSRQPLPERLSWLKSGMPEIRQALNRYQPPYYFFGHVGHGAISFADPNGVTSAYKLADLTWAADGQQIVNASSMGILRWQNRDDNSFEVLDAAWLNEYSAFTWEVL
jgi:predicted phosphodiesterase